MTNEELIAQAREATRCFCVDTPEQECGEHGDSYARGMAALADALEAATRVPVQGKPNDDREAKAEALAEWQDGNSMRQYSEWYTSWEDGYDAGFSRATMPNAATEELESTIYPDYEGLTAAVFERSHEPAFSDDSGGLREARAFAESLVEMYIDQQGMKQLKAERDAATRVPVQGEPNDDREAEELIVGAFPFDGSDPGTVIECRNRARMVVAALASRATVPDAATEQAKNAWHLSSDVWQARALKAEAEYNTTLTAIERVRAIHKVKHGEKPKYADDDYHAEREPVSWEKYSMCEGCSATWPCRTVAATYEAVVPGE